MHISVSGSLFQDFQLETSMHISVLIDYFWISSLMCLDSWRTSKIYLYLSFQETRTKHRLEMVSHSVSLH